MNKVSFFIIGAPKSGTSFIRKYLNLHPNIYIPEQEPVFMGDELSDLSEFKDIDTYHNLFGENLFSKNIKCGEKSSMYLATNAYKNIFKYNSDAKIILTIRNPIEAVYSYHNHNKIMGFEYINDFREAWDAQKMREKNNYKLPLYANNEKLRYKYKFIYSYSNHINNYSKYFNKNFKIIFYDDIKQDSKKVINDLFLFLNLEKLNLDSYEFKVVNKQPKVDIEKSFSNLFFRYRVFLPRKTSIKKISKSVKKILGNKILKFLFDKIFSLGFKINKLNTKLKIENNDVNKLIKSNHNEIKDKEFLIKEFNQEINFLSKKFNRNLDHWTK